MLVQLTLCGSQDRNLKQLATSTVKRQRESVDVSLLHSLAASCIYPRTQTKGMVPPPFSLDIPNEKISWGWRNGSLDKMGHCSSGETEFVSQHLVGQDPRCSSSLYEHQAYTRYIDICTDKIPKHLKE